MVMIFCTHFFHCISQTNTASCAHKPIILGTKDPCQTGKWFLAFEDEFDGNMLNETYWRMDYPHGRTILNNRELEYYSPNNVVVSNGILKLITNNEPIVAKVLPDLPPNYIIPDDNKPNLREFDYTSGMIYSNKAFGYGIYEIRCKIPRGKGFWPAFWTFSANPHNEIDIFEFWNEVPSAYGKKYDPDKLSTTVHFNIYNQKAPGDPTYYCPTEYYDGTIFSAATVYSDKFHIFTLIYDKYMIYWYIDGKMVSYRARFRNIHNQPIACGLLATNQYYDFNLAYPLKEFQHIIANLAIQGGHDHPDISTPFPSSYEIDYIRYYKQAPCDNLFIENIEQWPIDDRRFNTASGRSVTFAGKYKIPDWRQLEVVARDFIDFRPGFEVNSTCNMVARIDKTMCNESGKRDMRDTTNSNTSFIPVEDLESLELQDFEAFTQELETQKYDSSGLYIYPNPVTEILHVDFVKSEMLPCNLNLRDIQGRIIQSQAGTTSSVTLDLGSYQQGMYVVEIENIKTKKKHFYKILKN